MSERRPGPPEEDQGSAKDPEAAGEPAAMRPRASLTARSEGDLASLLRPLGSGHPRPAQARSCEEDTNPSACFFDEDQPVEEQSEEGEVTRLEQMPQEVAGGLLAGGRRQQRPGRALAPAADDGAEGALVEVAPPGGEAKHGGRAVHGESADRAGDLLSTPIPPPYDPEYGSSEFVMVATTRGDDLLASTGELDVSPVGEEAARAGRFPEVLATQFDGGIHDQSTVIAAAPPAARLVVEKGRDAGRQVAIRDHEISVGRGIDNELVLADIAVSRRHLTIWLDGGECRVRDLGSGNGTLVGGRRIQQAVLRSGDRIQLGNTVLRLDLLDGQAAAQTDHPSPVGRTATSAVIPPEPAEPVTSVSPVPSALEAASLAAGPGPGADAATGPALARRPGATTVPRLDSDSALLTGTANLHDARLLAARSTAQLPTIPGEPKSLPGQSGAPAGSAAWAVALGESLPPGGEEPGQSGAPIAAPGHAVGRFAGHTVGKIGGQATAVRRKPFASPGRRMLVVTLAICALGLVAAAAYKRILVARRNQQQAATSRAISARADQHFSVGVRHFKAGAWREARAEFEQVLLAVPDSSAAQKYVERCMVEERCEKVLARAERLAAAGKPAEAGVELGKVDPGCRRADDARRLLGEVATMESQALLEQAQALAGTGDREAALSKLDQILRLDPKQEAATRLREEILSGVGPRPGGKRPSASGRPETTTAVRPSVTPGSGMPWAPTAGPVTLRPATPGVGAPGSGARVPAERQPASGERPPATAPRGTASSAKEALSLYEKRNFAAAAAAMRGLAAGQRQKQAQRSLAMANDMAQMGQLLPQAEKAAAQGLPQALRLYEQAIALDGRASGGLLGRALRPRAGHLALAEAERALSSGRYEACYAAVKTAQRFSGEDAGSSRILGDLENKAGDLFARAYQLKAMSPGEAQALLLRVTKMVPASSPWHEKASRWLRQLAGQRTEEDDAP